MQAAFEVHNQLGPGLLEKLYERALVIELTEHGHKIEQQKEIIAKYKNQIIGKHILDLIVEDSVVLESV